MAIGTDTAAGDWPPNRTGNVVRVAGFERHVADRARAVDFYGEALGFALAPQPEESDAAELRLGSQGLRLLTVDGRDGQLRNSLAAIATAPVNNTRFQHFAIVVADMEAAMARLRRFAPQSISRGSAVRLPPATGSVTAFKFRDPDGHPLELIEFPPGTGDERWQRLAEAASIGAPCLGIDHSAIGVADVGRSIGFYQAVLGLSVASRGVNQGAEQAALDGVQPVCVDVVALGPDAASTPHIELLGYRTPAPVNPPAQSDSTTGAGDRIVLAVEDVDAVVQRWQTWCAATGRAIDSTPAADHHWVLHDPDGHALVLQPHGT